MIQFVSLVYFEGKLIAMKENGDLWQYDPQVDGTWTLLAYGPLHKQGF